MKIAHRRGQVHARRGQPAAQGDGDLPLARDDRAAAGQDGRADGRARLRPRFRAALLRPDQGLRRIWLSRKPRGELRAPGLRLELAQVAISGGVRRGAAQLAADGLLRAGADRARCARAWGRGACRWMSITAIGIARWSGRLRARAGRTDSPSASACARSKGLPERRRGCDADRGAVAARAVSPASRSLRDRAAACPSHAIERLAAADAFRSLGARPRAPALWDARALKPAPDLPLFAAAEARDEGAERAAARLPAMPLSEHVVTDYQTVRLSLKAHPMQLPARGITPSAGFRHRRRPADHPQRQARCRCRRAGADPPAAGQRQGRRASSRWRTRPASPTWSSGPTCSRSSARSSWARG